jgi:hypothetical protein
MTHEQLQAAVKDVFERVGVRAFLFKDDAGALFVEGVRGMEHYRVRIAAAPRLHECPFESLADIVFTGELPAADAERHLVAIRTRLRTRSVKNSAMNSDFSTEELLIEVGKTLLACQVVEKQLRTILNYIHPGRDVTLEELLAIDPMRDMLGPLIQRAAARFKYDDLTKAGLWRFKERRNILVHSLIHLPGFSLDSAEGRQIGAEFVLELGHDARGLSNALMPLIIEWAKQIGVEPA